jgi:hypothetical protein
MGRPLLVVHAAASANDNLIAAAARATGGWAVDLLRTDVDAAVEAAMRFPAAVRLTGPEVAPSSLLTSENARFAIAARSRDVLTVLHDLPLRELHGEVEASMVRRAWARARLREMLAASAADEDLTAHGRAFTQLTPRTSLLVLERWHDYVQWNIPMPPDVLAEKEAEEKALAARLTRPEPLPPPIFSAGAWTVSGRVLDDSGAPLPGVTVTLLDGSVLIAGTVTDAHGRYALGAASAPANPIVAADLPGFMATSRKVATDVPAGATVELFLRIAVLTESITVTAAAPTIEPMATASQSSLRTRILSGEALEDPELAEAAVKQRRELRKSVLERLRAIGSTAERVRYYVSARKLLGGDKGFHVFAAEIFRERSPELAVRVLSDLAEARPEDAPLLRILGRVVDGWGSESLARLLLERAIEISPTEPQSWREIILLEARHGRAASVAAWSRRMKAASQRGRMAAVYEQTAGALERWGKTSFFERQSGIDLRADDDLAVELMYDTGWSYVDLHVVEPSGERVAWNDDTSSAGATLTGGYTFGFGPQIYRLRKAPRGTYRLEIDYYSDDETTIASETLVHVIIHRRGQRSDHFLVMSEVEEHREFAKIDM